MVPALVGITDLAVVVEFFGGIVLMDVDTAAFQVVDAVLDGPYAAIWVLCYAYTVAQSPPDKPSSTGIVVWLGWRRACLELANLATTTGFVQCKVVDVAGTTSRYQQGRLVS